LDRLLADATEAQCAAITHLAGPLLVLAGPGSGKTRVVTRRIAWLMGEGVPPESILAITFTNKAAEEMRERVVSLVSSRGLWVSTFHSMGARMLRMSADRIGLDRAFTIYDDSDQVRVVREAMKALDIDTTQFRPEAVASRISALKSDFVAPEKAAGQAKDWFGEVVGRVYPVYERRLRESNGLDFDDLLVKNLEMLRNCDDVREHWQRRFRFVLVDEYQDTNRVQFLLLRALTGPERNLHVTGDPDQSIYGFRGADIRNILDFEKDYPNARVIRLEENFRSTPHILKAADSLIRHNCDRKPKDLFTARTDGLKVRVRTATDEEEEARIVVQAVLDALGRGVPYSEMAIFYRVHSLSRPLELAFLDRGVPYTIVRGTEFYRRAEVQDILAYLKIVANPKDRETLLRILNVPARGIGDASRERLLRFADEKGISLLEALRRVEEVPGVAGRALGGVRALSALFTDLAARRDGPVAPVVAEIVARIGYAAHLKQCHPDNHEERLENVEQLVSSGAEYEDRNPGLGLVGWLEEVSLMTDADRYDPRSARVSMMTLHTAKGLEFKVVFIVGCEEGLLPHSRSQAMEREREEERRLLFVGITRAKEELSLLHARQRRRWGEFSFSLRSSFLNEIDPAALVDEEMAAPPRSRDLRFEVDEYAQASPDPDPEPEAAVREGVLVRHSSFGLGRVRQCSGSGAAARVLVDFSAHGLKKLLLSYARLEVVEEGPR
jgi:DNA helicase-2/ATP-dependent DNA helicase PcrA